MNGQWIGSYTGTNSGMIIVELDDLGGHYEGSVLAVDNNPILPSTLGEFLAPKGEKEFKSSVRAATHFRKTISRQNIRASFEQATLTQNGSSGIRRSM